MAASSQALHSDDDSFYGSRSQMLDKVEADVVASDEDAKDCDMYTTQREGERDKDKYGSRSDKKKTLITEDDVEGTKVTVVEVDDNEETRRLERKKRSQEDMVADFVKILEQMMNPRQAITSFVSAATGLAAITVGVVYVYRIPAIALKAKELVIILIIYGVLQVLLATAYFVTCMQTSIAVSKGVKLSSVRVLYCGLLKMCDVYLNYNSSASFSALSQHTVQCEVLEMVVIAITLVMSFYRRNFLCNFRSAIMVIDKIKILKDVFQIVVGLLVALVYVGISLVSMVVGIYGFYKTVVLVSSVDYVDSSSSVYCPQVVFFTSLVVFALHIVLIITKCCCCK